MKEKYVRRWEKTRKLGKTKYILYFGVLGWGVLTATIYNLISYFGQSDFSSRQAILSYIFLPLSGVLWGHFTWNSYEKNYETFIRLHRSNE